MAGAADPPYVRALHFILCMYFYIHSLSAVCGWHSAALSARDQLAQSERSAQDVTYFSVITLRAGFNCV